MLDSNSKVRVRCKNYHLPHRLKRDPHNQRSPDGGRYTNDLKGNASRSLPPLLRHSLPRSLLPRQSNQRRPHGLNGNVRDLAVARMVAISSDVLGAHS